MNREKRNNLRTIINKCKKVLEDEITRGIGYYGIRPDGTIIDTKNLEHITNDKIQVRKNLLESIEKEKIGGLDDQDAILRYIRHTGFTYLNRFAALRAMEVRGLIKETIIRRKEYHGGSLREMQLVEINPNLQPDLALKQSLIEAFKEAGQEIHELFDVDDSYSIVFPDPSACLRAISLLLEVTEGDWREDDIIGWIYQYYNEESRNEFRKAKRRPTPDDMAIISQFYTPDWIVKVLVDNTLGRLWFDMNRNSKLAKFFQYHIRQQSNLGVKAKSVREIKLLDPACGSGHFLVYAFELFTKMYEEEEPNLAKSEIATLILEENLYGIDIDLRASQLTALSLYLKAKTYDPNVKIKRMNVVCADIRVSDGDRRHEFLKRFEDDPPLKDIFERLFIDLNNTFAIGSLLQIRKPFETLFKSRNQPNSQKSNKLSTGQTTFILDTNEGKRSLILDIQKERTIEDMMKELRNLEREALEEKDIGRLLFATETEKSVGLLDLLTQKYDVIVMNPPHGEVTDESKSYIKSHYPRTYYDYYSAFLEQCLSLTESHGLLGVLTGRSIMVNKNMQKLREETLKDESLPEVVLDLGFKTLEEAHARFAALTIKKSSKYTDDTMNHEIKFYSLARFEWENKRHAFEKAISNEPSKGLTYTVKLSELMEVPGTPYAYWAPQVLRKIFRKFPPLDRESIGRKDAIKIADVKQGLATADLLRFCRFWWEVPTSRISLDSRETFDKKKWVPYAYVFYLFYFYSDYPIVVNWKNDGNEIKNLRDCKGKILSRAQNTKFYFQEGLTWSAGLQRTQVPKLWRMKRLAFRNLPSGVIFSDASHAVITKSEYRWPLLAILCSKLIFAISRMVSSENRQGTGPTAILPIAFDKTAFANNGRLYSLAKEAHDITRYLYTGDETSTVFIKPWLISWNDENQKPITSHPLSAFFEFPTAFIEKYMTTINPSSKMTMQELMELFRKRLAIVQSRLEEIQNEIDEEVFSMYGVSDEERQLIETELEILKGSDEDLRDDDISKGNQEDVESLPISSTDQVERLISYFIKKAIEMDEDGIVPIDQMFEDNLIEKVQKELVLEFGKQGAERIENEIKTILKVPLAVWIERSYSIFHVQLYRRRPIFWQLTSQRFGKSNKGKGAFSCFIYYHKLTSDTIPKIQGQYLVKVMERLKRDSKHLLTELKTAKTSKNKKNESRLSLQHEETVDRLDELERFNKELTRLQNIREDKSCLNKNPKWVDRMIAEIRDNGWTPAIDYGIRVNIEPVKQLKLLHSSYDGIN